MVKKTQKQSKNKLFIFLVVTTVLFLLVIVGILTGNYKQNLQSESHANTENWLSYVDKDLPYTFDYPSDLHFEKTVYESDGSNFPAGYKSVTLNGFKENREDVAIYIRYENGNSGISMGASVACSKSQEFIQISNSLSSTNARICDGNKEWSFKEEPDANGKSHDRIYVYSTKDANMDASLFKGIIDSIREK